MADVEMDARRANGSKDAYDWAQKSVEGWIIIVTGLNEETQEEDLQDLFGEFGEMRNLSIALNRRTGYVMGYALIEYANKEEAEAAIKGTSGTEFLEKTITTDFAFSKGSAANGRSRGAAGGPRRGGGRDRDQSPSRR